METRNLQYTENDTINMEINHPIYGWIPFTADANDTEELGKGLYAKAISGELGAIQAYVAPVIPPKTAEQLKAERKALIAQQLEVLTVTTAAGNVFDANVQARLDISNAIMISDAVGITETVWRLADDSEALVTVAELKEALMLALTEYARIKGIGA